MKLEKPKPRLGVHKITSLGGGVTSPYAKPPMAPVFVVSFGDGGRLTLDETEAVELHAQLSTWVDGLEGLKRRIAVSAAEEPRSTPVYDIREAQ